MPISEATEWSTCSRTQEAALFEKGGLANFLRSKLKEQIPYANGRDFVQKRYTFCPNGATSYSPGLPGFDGYPGNEGDRIFNRNAVATRL